MVDSESEGEWSPWGAEEEEHATQPLIGTPASPSQRNLASGMDDTRPTIPLVARHSKGHAAQYLTAFAATMGALAAGTVLGYSSPAGPKLMSNTTTGPLHLTTEQNMWFSSSMNLGALMGGPVGGLCLGVLGRRGTMLASTVPFVAGWLLIAFAQNFGMLMTGRIVTGLCAGITSLVVPTYIGEFASADVRGTLGSGFQLMITIGVMYAYAFGALVSTWQLLAGLCIIPSALYCILMLFAKESPYFLLSKGKEEQAAAALQFFRGKDCNAQTELDLMRQSLEDARLNKATLKDLAKPYIFKPLMISLALMFFQQFSGVNSVLFNLTTIFSDAGSTISDNMSSIIIGVVQVASTFLATVLMDKAGRRLLLIVSASFMALSLVALGEFFYEKMEDKTWAVNKLGWLPLTSLIIFITAFSIGYGPIPWLMIGELFSPNVKEAAGSFATMFNWSLAFVVTLTFVPLQTALGTYGVYWLYASICVVNLVFCVTIVPETKGKTLEEINAYFGGPSSIGITNAPEN
ncbi:facilitated trehalose transporter Tret1-2 homolog isoform X2 [Procambarus clarkii]|nr:facilitated trehalose transporter Tret1-2 homolog isoform X2 [Procambarus clarkii]XP_045615876.1 facilitated trehalose transporter Tret1-2 homolog isoform X2 [Procambarus clarkii]XP_045615878.1 facilitated trehalose transporter Tret1-2 homolog isoform X2 [Procambarus clarkii]XP_045615879.1 facilitated trehalose transporter Tret1-2 homolog isoform X2 [Procambarus clarkii]